MRMVSMRMNSCFLEVPWRIIVKMVTCSVLCTGVFWRNFTVFAWLWSQDGRGTRRLSCTVECGKQCTVRTNAAEVWWFSSWNLQIRLGTLVWGTCFTPKQLLCNKSINLLLIGSRGSAQVEAGSPCCLSIWNIESAPRRTPGEDRFSCTETICEINWIWCWRGNGTKGRRPHLKPHHEKVPTALVRTVVVNSSVHTEIDRCILWPWRWNLKMCACWADALCPWTASPAQFLFLFWAKILQSCQWCTWTHS